MKERGREVVNGEVKSAVYVKRGKRGREVIQWVIEGAACYN